MINRWAHKIMLYIAEIALATMVFIVFMTVVLRYCFNTGIGWAEEVPRLLVTLFAFLAMAFGVRDHIHISVNIVYNRCGPVGKWWFDKVSDSAVLLCGLYMFLYGGERLLKMATLPGTLPMTGWPIWVQYLPIPLCGFLITFDSLLFITGILKKDDLLYSEKETDYVAVVKQQEAAK
jgi:TRAP-type C4-dicarboxylate transport system permease small subunit